MGDILATLDKLTDMYVSFRNADGAVFFEDTRGEFHVCTKYQALFKFTSTDALETALHRHVMEWLCKAEMNAPGSFDVTLEELLRLRTNVGMARKIDCRRSPRRDDVRAIIERFAPEKNNSFLGRMLMDVFTTSGFNGKVVIEKAGSEPHIERVDGYNFKLLPAINVGPRVALRDVRVVCIEGHIASVADGHFLFQQVHESGEPCALFVRGLSDEVKHTLKVNWTRGTMKILPFVAEYGFEGANTLVDVATVCGNDLISTLRGDRISMIKLDQHKRVSSLDSSTNGVVIVNDKTHVAVKNHLNALREKHDASDLTVQDFIRPRIHSLLSGVTYVRLPDDASYVFNAQLVDFVIRTVRSALGDGVVDVDGCVMPAAALDTSHAHAKKCVDTLTSLGAAVVTSC